MRRLNGAMAIALAMKRFVPSRRKRVCALLPKCCDLRSAESVASHV